jgi:hypothetical protein
MAQQMQAWQATGIPLNDRAAASIAKWFMGSGIAAPRAIEMTRGFSGYLQGMGQRGIQSGLDLFMLTTIGGYKGGGAKGYEEALLRLEKLRGASKGDILGNQEVRGGLLQMVNMFGGDEYAQRSLLRSMLSRTGMQMGVEESSLLLKQLKGWTPEKEPEKFTPDELDAHLRNVAQEQRAKVELDAGAAESPAKLQEMAASYIKEIGPNLQKQAQIQNQQLQVGTDILTAVQQLEKSATNANTAFTELAKGPLTSLTSAFESLTAMIAEVVEVWMTTGPKSAGVN